MAEITERLLVHGCGLPNRPVAIEVVGPLPVTLTVAQARRLAAYLYTLTSGRQSTNE
jgi:hypothetical protein